VGGFFAPGLFVCFIFLAHFSSFRELFCNT